MISVPHSFARVRPRATSMCPSSADAVMARGGGRDQLRSVVVAGA